MRMVNEYGHEIVTFRDLAAVHVAAASMATASGLACMPKEDRADIFAELAMIAYEVADALDAHSKESA